eukprot:c3925_g1_i1.p1 GENE.c3925_g1_i1~~c3925_g1_i1.p1  ORF type:complete len:461 (+),score=100.21 c3925_g1_i1:3-1385(+)
MGGKVGHPETQPTMLALRRCVRIGWRQTSYEVNAPFMGVRLSKEGHISDFTMSKRELLSILRDDVRFHDLRNIQKNVASIPAILVRKSCVIVSMSETQAIIMREEALVFQANESLPAAQLARVIKDRLPLPRSNRIPKTQNKEETSNTRPPINIPDFDYPPFELCVFDSLLDHITATKRRQMRLLHDLTKVAIDDLTRSITQTSVQMLLPITSALKRFESELSQLHTAVDEILESDEDMTQMQLTAKSFRQLHNSEHEEIEILLETYRQRLRETLAECSDVRNTVTDFNGLLEIKLDLYRNQLIRITLGVSIATMGIGVAALGAGILGMNIPFPPILHQPDIFGPVTASIMLSGACAWLVWGFVYQYSKRIDLSGHKYRALANLLSEVKQVDLAMRGLPSPTTLQPEGSIDDIDKETVKAQLTRHLHHRSVSEQDVAIVTDMMKHLRIKHADVEADDDWK